MALFERVRSIIETQLGVDADEVTPGASFVDDLGADSLDLVELIMSFEDEFKDEVPDLEISDEEAELIATVQTPSTSSKTRVSRGSSPRRAAGAPPESGPRPSPCRQGGRVRPGPGRSSVWGTLMARRPPRTARGC